MASSLDLVGMSNLVGCILLALMSALFLRARRTEFTLAFAANTGVSALQKILGGLWLYFPLDAATSLTVMRVAFITWLPILATFVHAMAAFGRSPSRPLPRSVVAAIYAPCVLLAPWGILQPDAYIAAVALPFFALFTALNVPFLAIAWRVHRNAPTVIQRTEGRYMVLYLAITAPIVAEGLAIFLLFGRFALWEIALAYAVGTAVLLYGALKHEIFDLNAHARRAALGTMAAGAFALLFLGLEQLLQDVLAGGTSGLVAAAASAAAVAPLAHVARKPLERLLPDAGEARKVELYRAQLELALADGAVTDREAELLGRTRRALGITEAQHSLLEREVRTGLAA